MGQRDLSQSRTDVFRSTGKGARQIWPVTTPEENIVDTYDLKLKTTSCSITTVKGR